MEKRMREIKEKGDAAVSWCFLNANTNTTTLTGGCRSGTPTSAKVAYILLLVFLL